MKTWKSKTAFGIDELITTLNWIEANTSGVEITNIILVKDDPEGRELYRIIYYEQ